MTNEEIAELTFKGTSLGRFQRFFKSNGWRFNTKPRVYKQLKSRAYLVIYSSGRLSVMNGVNNCGVATFATIGEALDATNKIAEVLGGWAE